MIWPKTDWRVRSRLSRIDFAFANIVRHYTILDYGLPPTD